MLNFLKEGLIPYEIEATVSFPQEVLLKTQELKDSGEDINQDLSFVSTTFTDPGRGSYHAGMVDFLQAKRTKMYNGKEGNWYYVSTAQMNRLDPDNKYYYNFEPARIKPLDLKDINILSYRLASKDNDGVLLKDHSYNLKIDHELFTDINSLALPQLSNISYLIKMIIPDSKIIDLSFDSNDLSVKKNLTGSFLYESETRPLKEKDQRISFTISAAKRLFS